MNKAGRGWSQASQMKPAAEYDIRYGSGLLKKESSGWPPYLMVSTPTAHETAQPYLSNQPIGIAHAMWLDSKHQKEISDSLPDDAELVVGLGGGRALDVSKFVALDKDLPLIMVPTIVSTGAIIHGVVAKWNGREIVGTIDDWPWVDCDHILVDDDLILEAPYYLNTAGLGDILCGYAAPAEWRWRAKNGIGPPCDEAVIDQVLSHHEELTQGFEATLDTEGNLTGQSVRHIMKSVQERDSRWIQRTEAESGDHPFWLALEERHNTSYIHGEMVAFSAIIIAWQCDEQPEILTDRLDRCKVRRRPKEVGITREELRAGLEFAPSYMEKKDTNTILRHRPITGSQFDRLWEFLEAN